MTSPAPRTAKRFVVTGLVQGVGFRWATARLARSLGLDGTVGNRPDGAVEIEAAGSPEALDALERALASGMPGRVDAVESGALAEPGGRSGFRILG